MSKVVGIRIEGSNRIYYYLTNKNYNVGQKIRVLAPSGGTPDAVVVETDSNRRFPKMKMLEEVE